MIPKQTARRDADRLTVTSEPVHGTSCHGNRLIDIRDRVGGRVIYVCIGDPNIARRGVERLAL